ncbi:MAG: DUF2341 domain-containing protein [Candidatus Diapherotrites archaeon]
MAYTSGKFGQALQGATNDYVSGPDSLNLGTTATIAAWLSPNMIVKKYDAGNENKYINLTETSSECALATATNAATISCSQSYSASEWYFIACVLDGSNRKIYVNGKECNSAAASGDVNDSSGTLYLGYEPIGGSYSTGKADSVMVFTRALSSDELTQLYRVSCMDSDFTTSTKCWYNWDITNIADGNYYVDINIYDTYGAIGGDSSDNNFMVDSNAPNVTVNNLGADTEAPYEDTIKDFDTNAYLDVTDYEMGEVQCWWDDIAGMASPNGECTKNASQYFCDFGNLLNGSYSYYYTCGDRMDNNSTTSQLDFTVNMANTNPDVNVNLPNGGETISATKDGNYTIDFNIMDTDGDVLTADIYYSSAAGGFEELIVSDFNLSVLSDYPLADGTYEYKRTITLSPTTPSANYQVKVQLTTGNFDYSNVLSGGDDLRFTDTGNNLLDYWIETWNASGTSTLWVEVPTSGTSTINLHYGNSEASADTNGANTFVFFDDFPDSSVNTSNWTITNATGWSVTGGELKGTNTTGRLTSITTFSNGVILESKSRYITIGANGHQVLGTWLSTSNGLGFLNHPVNDYYRSNGGWVAMAATSPAATNLYTKISIKSSTQADISVTNYNTDASYQNVSNISNTISSEPIVIGQRYDNLYTGQSYETYWDWIRVRKYAATEPTASIGSEDTHKLPYGCSDLNFVNSTNCTYDWNTISISDGNYYIDVNIADSSDANKFDSSNSLFQIDNTAPTVSLVSLAGDSEAPYLDSVSDGDTNLLLSISDFNAAGVACKWNDTNVVYASMGNSCTKSGIQYTCSFGDIVGGTYTYYYACQDYRENAYDTNSISFTVAGSAPAVILNSPSGGDNIGYVTDYNYGIDFNISDADTNVYADIYYSTTPGTFENLIVKDLDLNAFWDIDTIATAIWPMDETSGTTVSNLVSSSYPGTATGSTIVGGKFANARSLPGGTASVSRIDVADNAVFDSPKTLIAWVKPTDSTPPQDGFIISKRHYVAYDFFLGGPYCDGWRLYQQTNGLLRWQIDNDCSGASVYSDAPLPTDEYSMVAVTQNASGINMYVYNTQDKNIYQANQANNGPSANTEPLRIGNIAYTESTDNGFEGIIDDVRVYNSVLTDDQVNRIYNHRMLNNGSCENRGFTNSTKCVYFWDILGVADGNYYIDVNIHDPQDNNATDSSTTFFQLDNTAPDINIASLGGDTTANPYFDSTDDSAVDLVLDVWDLNMSAVSCRWDVNNAVYTSMRNDCTKSGTQYTCPFGDLDDSTYTRYYSCRDYLTNTSAPTPILFKVAIAGPTTSTDANGLWQDTDFNAHLFCAAPPNWFDSSFAYRKAIAIQNVGTTNLDNTYALDAGDFNTAELIAAGKMKSDCSDLRIVYNGAEIDREILGCNTGNSLIQFKLQNSIPAATGSVADNYQNLLTDYLTETLTTTCDDGSVILGSVSYTGENCLFCVDYEATGMAQSCGVCTSGDKSCSITYGANCSPDCHSTCTKSNRLKTHCAADGSIFTTAPVDNNYTIYYGNPAATPPPNDYQDIFRFGDNFNDNNLRTTPKDGTNYRYFYSRNNTNANPISETGGELRFECVGACTGQIDKSRALIYNIGTTGNWVASVKLTSNNLLQSSLAGIFVGADNTTGSMVFGRTNTSGGQLSMITYYANGNTPQSWRNLDVTTLPIWLRVITVEEDDPSIYVYYSTDGINWTHGGGVSSLADADWIGLLQGHESSSTLVSTFDNFSIKKLIKTQPKYHYGTEETYTSANNDCDTTKYRIDTDPTSGESMPESWQDYDSNIYIAQEGDWKLEFYSTDDSATTEATKSAYVRIKNSVPPALSFNSLSGDETINARYQSNYLIDFNITDLDFNNFSDNIHADIYYSTASGIYENSIITGFDLNSLANPNLVGFWPLDENTGAWAYDLSGFRENALVSIAGVNRASPNPQWISGVRDGAIDLNIIEGLDFYLPVSLALTAQDLTFSAWIYPKYNVNNSGIALGDSTQISYEESYLERDADGTIQWATGGSNIFGRPTLTSSGTLALNTWSHLVATCDYSLNSKKLFFNGIFDTAGPTIGAGAYCWHNFVRTGFGTGLLAAQLQRDNILSIDDIKFYNRALTPGEVEREYKFGFPQPCSDSNFMNQVDCGYDWNTSSVNPGRYYIDINIYDEHGHEVSFSSPGRLTIANFIDNTGPIGTILINNDDVGTESTTVNLSMTYSDDYSGTTDMSFSCDNSNWAEWETVSTVKNGFDMSANEAAGCSTATYGDKTIYVRFRDAEGNIGQSSNDTIFYDDALPPGSPQVSVAAYSGRTGYTNDPTPMLNTIATLAYYMRFSCASSYTSNASYATAYNLFDVASGSNGCQTEDGNRLISAIYEDSVGNSASAVETDSFYLDRTNPVFSSFTITDTNGFTTDSSPEFTISAADSSSSGMDGMKFSCNQTEWSQWFTYDASLNSGADDFRIGDYNFGCAGAESELITVYTKVRDRGFNESEILTDTTYYDINPPEASVSVVGGTDITDANLLLEIAATDNASGVKDVALSCDDSTYTSVYDFNTQYSDTNRVAYLDFNVTSGAGCVNEDGSKIIYAKIRDHLNNSLVVSTTVVLDLPIGANDVDIDIIDNFGYTNLSKPIMKVQIGSALDVNAMRFSCDNSNWSTGSVVSADYNSFDVVTGAGCSAGDGSKTIYAQFYSPASGNWGSYSSSDSTTYDATAPTGTIVASQSNYYVLGYTNDSTPLFDTAATDATAGMHEMAFSCDGSLFTDWVTYTSQYFDFNLLDPTNGGCQNIDGNKTAYIKYKDRAENQIVVNTTNSTIITLEGDDDNFRNKTGLVLFDGGATGQILYLQSSDSSFVIDTNNPYDVNVELDIGQWSGLFGYTNDDAPPFVINGQDLTSSIYDMAFSCNGIDFSSKVTYTKYYSSFDVKPNSFQYGCPVRDGQRRIYVRLTDRSGNSVVGAADTGIWWLDTVMPVLSSIIIDTSDQDTTSDSVPPISINASDTLSGLYDLNLSCNPNGPWKNQSYTSVISDFNLVSGLYGCGTSQGLKRIYAIVRDRAYNESVVKTDDVSYDLSAVEEAYVSINGVAKNSWIRDSSVTLRCTSAASDIDVYEFRYTIDDNGTGWTTLVTDDTDGSYLWTTPDNDSNIAIDCRFKDTAANYSNRDTAYYSGIDKSVPATTDNIPVGWQTSVSVTLTCTDTGPSACERSMYRLNSGSWFTYVGPVTVTTEGINTFYYYSIDNAANQEGTKSKQIYIDAIQPVLNSITIADTAEYTATRYPSISVSKSGDSSYIEFNCDNGSSWRRWTYNNPISLFDITQSGYGCLNNANGSVTVYARLVDLAGNLSEVKSDTTYYDTIAPSSPSILIEGGAGATNDTTPLLNLSATDSGSGLYQMQFSCNGSSWTSWTAYATSYSRFNLYTSSYGCGIYDGLRNIYVRFMDRVGNVSSSASDNIYLDAGPPVNNSISISSFSGTLRYTNDTTPNFSTSSNGATFMRFSCSSNPSNFTSNITYGSSYNDTFDITTGAGCSNTDGAKQVYAIYEDDTNNSSSPVSTYANGGYFYLDRSKPVLTSMAITKTSGYTSDSTPPLTFSASDSTSGVYEARFSCNGSSWSGWYAYSASMSSPISLRSSSYGCLPLVDGTVTLYSQLRDRAYNISNEIRNDSVIVDTTSPTGTILIEGGAASTTNQKPALTISASDVGIGVSQMRFSCNGSSWTDWTAYATSYSDFNIISGSQGCAYGGGTKYVFAQFRDTLTNTSSSVSDSIILNWAPPADPGEISTSIIVIDNFGFTNDSTPQINISVVAGEDASVSHMRFSCDNASWTNEVANDTSYSSFNIASGTNGCSTSDGSRTIYAQFKDGDGIWGNVASDTTNYDTTPPATGTISVTYTGTSGYVNNITPTFNISGAGADWMRFSCNGVSYNSNILYAITHNSFNIRPASTIYGCGTADGTRAVYVLFSDYAGNIATSAASTPVFTLDTAPPSNLSLSTTYSGLSGYVNTATPVLNFLASDGLSGVYQMQFSCNGSSWKDWQSYSNSISNFNLSSELYGCDSIEGARAVFARARDNAYNVSPSTMISFVLDSEAPQNQSIEIERWTGNYRYTFDDAPPLVLSASDATSGVYEMQFSCDNSDWTDAWKPFAYRYSIFDVRPTFPQYGCNVDQGTKIIYTRFRDRAYNISADANTGYWTLDQNAPIDVTISVAAFTGIGRYTNDSSPSFTVSSKDTLSGISSLKFSCNDVDYTGWLTFDASGQDCAVSCSQTFNVGAVTDFDVKSGLYGCGTEDGNRTVYAVVRDDAGVTSVSNHTGKGNNSFYVDTTAPSVSVDAPTENQMLGGVVQLFNTISDSGSGMFASWLTVNRDGNSTIIYDANLTSEGGWDSDWNSDSYSEDIYNLTVNARDRAGNIISTVRNFNVSRLNPTIQFLVPNPNNLYYSSSIDYNVYFSHFALQDVNVEVMNNSDSNNVVSTQSSEDLNNTSTTSTYLGATINISGYSNNTVFWVDAEATDTASNYARAITYFIVDNSAPTGDINIMDTNNFTRSTTPDLNLTYSDAVSSVEFMRFSCDNSNWTGWITASATYSGFSIIDTAYGCNASDGSKTIYVQYRDSAGNASISYSDSTTLDTGAPSGTIVIAGGAQTTNSQVPALTLSASDGTGIGVKDMAFSCNNLTWTDYVAYATSYSDFNLFDTTTAGCTNRMGFREVYVQFRDTLNNSSLISVGSGDYVSDIYDTIFVDINIDAAAEMDVCPEYLESAQFTLSWAGASDSNSLAYYNIQVSPNGINWQPIHQTSTGDELSFDYNILTSDLNGVCGDGRCTPGENCPNDSYDCPFEMSCTNGCRPQADVTFSCGDSRCDPGEYCPIDTVDCAFGYFCRSGCQPDTIPPDNQSPTCPDNVCDSGEYCMYDSVACYNSYGDGWMCKGGIGVDGCVQTTSVAYQCGDGTCDIGENCPYDNANCEIGMACINGCVPTNDTTALGGGKSFDAFNGSLDGFMFYKVETFDEAGNMAESETIKCIIDAESPFQMPYGNGRAIVRATDYGDYNIYVPPSASSLGSDTNLSVDYNATPPTFRFGRMYKAFNIDTPEHSFAFNSDTPATLTLSYTESELDCAPSCTVADEEKLKLYWWNDDTNSWNAVPSTVDTTNNKVTGDVNHFSPWGVGEDEDPPTLTSVTITDTACDQSEGCTNDTTPTITIDAGADSEDMNISCSVTGPWLNQPYTSSVTDFDISSSSYGCLGGSDGSTTVYVKVADDSANWSSAENDSTYYDSTAPVVTISSPTNGSTVTTSTVTLQYSAVETGSGIGAYWVKVDSDNWILNNSLTSYIYAGQSDGEHTYSVKAGDKLDTNSTTAWVTVTASVSGETPGGNVCGNGNCETGESCSSCPNDCGSCSACDNDGICESGENSTNCPNDCPICDNDGVCESGENITNCPNDCGGTSCGDGSCNGLEICGTSDVSPECQTDCGVCNNRCVSDLGGWVCEALAYCPSSLVSGADDLGPGQVCCSTPCTSDLTVSSISSSIDADEGEIVYISAAITNLSGSVNQNFRVSLREDSASGNELAFQDITNSLDPMDEGESVQVLFEFIYDRTDSVMADWNGIDKEFYVVADSLGDITEINESNNDGNAVIYFSTDEKCGNLRDDDLDGLIDEYCGIPDLYISSTDVASPVFIGNDLVEVDFNVVISSDYASASNFDVGFYKNDLNSSPMGVAYIDTISETENILIISRIESDIFTTIRTAGEEAGYDLLLQAPDPDIVDIFVYVDSGGAIDEVSENNNITQIGINPDGEICGNGIDDNNNGEIDEGCVELCGDGIDNNGDGQVDEGCVELCGDGIDNNNNGRIDEGCGLVYSYNPMLRNEELVYAFWQSEIDLPTYLFGLDDLTTPLADLDYYSLRRFVETAYVIEYPGQEFRINEIESTPEISNFRTFVFKNDSQFGIYDFGTVIDNRRNAFFGINDTRLMWWNDPIFLVRMHYMRIDNLRLLWWNR